MNTLNPTQFGFRPMTQQDFYGYAGASSDSFIKEDTLRPNDKESPSIVAIYSPSEKSLHVYLYDLPDVDPAMISGYMVDGQAGSAILALHGYGNLLEALRAEKEHSFEAFKKYGIEIL